MSDRDFIEVRLTDDKGNKLELFIERGGANVVATIERKSGERSTINVNANCLADLAALVAKVGAAR